LKAEETELRDVWILTPRRFGDDRGWFSETWNSQALAAGGFDLAFV
jgi:dTDP-4-dehydrorhamnose 3,5-epimerase